jgi:hypothetical protein
MLHVGARLLPRNPSLVPNYVDPEMTRSGRERDQPRVHHPPIPSFLCSTVTCAPSNYSDRRSKYYAVTRIFLYYFSFRFPRLNLTIDTPYTLVLVWFGLSMTLLFSHSLRLMFMLHSDPFHLVPSQLASPNQTLWSRY